MERESSRTDYNLFIIQPLSRFYQGKRYENSISYSSTQDSPEEYDD